MLITPDGTFLSPADLTGHRACPHLSAQRRDVDGGRRPRPPVADEHAQLIREKGREHERAYLERLQAAGVTLETIPEEENPTLASWRRAAERTLAAMARGVPHIYQAAFLSEHGLGRADFVERVERPDAPTALGPFGYEAVDTKLARAEKPDYLLQLCFYSEAIGRIQEVPPERMHVELGSSERRSFLLREFDAYFRRARAEYREWLGLNAETTPYPCDHCSLCEYSRECGAWWEETDHLSRVAGIRRDQVQRLQSAGIVTLDALSRVEPAGTAVPELKADALDELHRQARLQRLSAESGRVEFEWRDFVDQRGYGLLPPPDPGDLFIDLEGDPFWEPARELTFLFGLLDADARYEAIWAHDRPEEQRLVEQVVDRLVERRERHPGMHVYHYGVPEPTVIKKLTGLYGTREAEVDQLLRGEVFVDLHGVVKQALRAGVERYSLKHIEPLVGFRRDDSLGSGTQAVLAYERWMQAHDADELERIAAYNREDCRATQAARDWLVRHRPPGAPPYKPPEEKAAKDDVARDAREALRRRLTDAARPGSPDWIAGQLLDYHQRENRPGWWTFFQRRDRMTREELLADSESLTGLRPVAGVEPQSVKKSRLHSLTFPEQPHKLSAGKEVHDPATKKSAGTIVAIRDDDRRLELKRGPSLKDAALPVAVIPGGPVTAGAQQGALARLAAVVEEDGDRGPRYGAVRELLHRRLPRVHGVAPGSDLQTNEIPSLQRLVASLDSSYLFIQGPPGSGKTYTGARLAVHLMAEGRRVGVAALSHAAIHNLLEEIEVAASQRGLSFRGLKKASGPEGDRSRYRASGSIANETDNRKFENLPADVLLIAGTSWLFGRPGLDGAGPDGPPIDTLLIDEAGQISLADALAMGTCARNLLLLGDPQQLPQVSQGAHPPGTGVSVLEHLLGDDRTIAPDRGIFLEQTRRMHPAIGRFISDVVYGGRLSWVDEVAEQTTDHGTGLRYLPCPHQGNGSASVEEARRIAACIGQQVGAGFVGKGGVAGRLRPGDFMVVTPYNAQVRKLQDELRRVGLEEVPVGTVDRFQGQEAAIVYFSMATSSGEDIPRNAEFLFSRNRLNVAISRARCLVHLVCCPDLLNVRAGNVEQMRLINVLCRFIEDATVVDSTRVAG